MPYYIRLIKFTAKGAQGIRDFPTERAEFLKKAEELGIKIHGVYITLGRYDMVSILEAPDEKTILRLHASYVGPNGRTSSETLTAVTAEEFEKIVKSA